MTFQTVSQKEWKKQSERVEETIIKSGRNNQKEWKEQLERVEGTSRKSGRNNRRKWKKKQKEWKE